MADSAIELEAFDLERFVERVWAEGASRYRELPWRNIDDAYGVLVSEVMLQQTQVSRVLKHWERFMALFPTIDALAAADTAFVLEQWQGLGYNRRALALKRAAEQCSERYAGALPRTREELVELPGIGQATAAGVISFAYNEPSVYIETNVRTVFIHELFPRCREGGRSGACAPCRGNLPGRSTPRLVLCAPRLGRPPQADDCQPLAPERPLHAAERV